MSQNDETVWKVINHQFCSFKLKTKTLSFCRNEYNLTGLCNRTSCPLANSRYATINEKDGRCYLMIKTIERSHMPNRLWRKIRLKKNYNEALVQIDKHLMYWPKYLIHKNKHRLTKISQYLGRVRKLMSKNQTKIATLPTKLRKRDRRRESKAESVARLEQIVENELLTRLESKVYGDIYNFPERAYKHTIETQELEERDGWKETESEAVIVDNLDENRKEKEERGNDKPNVRFNYNDIEDLWKNTVVMENRNAMSC